MYRMTKLMFHRSDKVRKKGYGDTVRYSIRWMFYFLYVRRDDAGISLVIT